MKSVSFFGIFGNKSTTHLEPNIPYVSEVLDDVVLDVSAAIVVRSIPLKVEQTKVRNTYVWFDNFISRKIDSSECALCV